MPIQQGNEKTEKIMVCFGSGINWTQKVCLQQPDVNNKNSKFGSHLLYCEVDSLKTSKFESPLYETFLLVQCSVVCTNSIYKILRLPVKQKKDMVGYKFELEQTKCNSTMGN